MSSVCNQLELRWPPRPTDFKKGKLVFHFVNFTDTDVKFGVVVTEIDLQHIEH